MCILCVIQKWSRKIATMLPWLVIPLIGLWLLSQFLPPAFRFEITSPRLACVLVLLVTLFWYEILMPQLSAWRVRRNARLRERKRFEAIEMQKLRKTATRRCRNCLTAYRDQNPGGGKFMCCYCGHVSKRPVLDLPLPPGLGGLTNGGILKDLVGKGGKMLNGKVWSDNGWVCGQDWLENGGSWVGGSFSGKSGFRGNNNGYSSGGDDNCFAEKSYSSFVVFIYKILASVFMSIMWIWRKVFRVGSSDEDALSDGEMRDLAKKGENGMNCNESKSEKARRKAEEKRQARLEKEQLEEEERKQREEVARLVEERRKLRDEITEAEKDRCKVSLREKNNKREVEKKRHEKKKDKDRGSSKSNSDADELEKRAVKESERNKKLETDRRENQKGTTQSNNIGSVGTRYLDRMRGSFLSSSRAFTGGGFFGKGTGANTSSTRELKSSVASDHVQNTTSSRRDPTQSEPPGKSNASTDDKNIARPVQVEPQPSGPKKSWQQLFTRTSTVPSSSSTNVISRPNGNSQKEVQSPISSHISVTQGFDNPITFGLPNTLPNFACEDPFINTGLQLSSNSVFPRVGEAPDKFLPEESDIFEDPCYVPDPVSLIGPVSESLGFVPDLGFQKPHPIKHMSDLSEVSKPSPIERHANSFFSTSTQTAQDMNSISIEDQGQASERGWQIWDSLGSAGDPSSWLLPAELSGPQPQRTMASLFKKDDQKTYSHYVPGTDDDPWMPMTYGSMSESDKHTTRNELVYGSPNGSAINHPFQLSQGNFWANKERAVPVSIEVGSASTTRAVGGLYSTPDVQSVWSYERREKGRT
uniref:stress response protein nst1-like n=1 Tax=Erigeron canadensis TaxID=72917 RepID=UPI001CB94006|nr:stress response protein nst1-like [Erigeron canadensis]